MLKTSKWLCIAIPCIKTPIFNNRESRKNENTVTYTELPLEYALQYKNELVLSNYVSTHFHLANSTNAVESIWKYQNMITRPMFDFEFSKYEKAWLIWLLYCNKHFFDTSFIFSNIYYTLINLKFNTVCIFTLLEVLTVCDGKQNHW